MPLHACAEAQPGSLYRPTPAIQAQRIRVRMAVAQLKSLPGALYPSAMLVIALNSLPVAVYPSAMRACYLFSSVIECALRLDLGRRATKSRV